MQIPSPIRFRPVPQEADGLIANLKHVSGVYLLYSAGAPLHLSWSANLERRLRRLLSSLYPGSDRPARLGDKLDAVECWPTGSRLELQILLYHLAKTVYPQRYLQFLKLRMPWFVGLSDAGRYPRLDTVNYVDQKSTAMQGPFAGRAAAEQYQQEVAGLFQIRRCREILAPSPDHPGCIYGEMNQCLRPCQQVVTDEEYAAETVRVEDFLKTNGRGAIALLSSARTRASDEAEFEQAALIHKRIEKLKSAASWRDAVIRDAADFSGLALTRTWTQGRLFLWPLLRGFWREPIALEFPEGGMQEGKSLDAELRERVAVCLTAPHAAGEHPLGDRTEELAIFARWYYSSWRDGEWFPFSASRGPDYRKLVREISRMVQAAEPNRR